MTVTTPADVEISWKRKERKFASFMAQQSLVWILVAIAILGCSIYLIEHDQLNDGTYFIHNGGFQILRMVRRSLYVVLFLSPLTIFAGARVQLALQSLCLILVWITSASYFFPLMEPGVYLLINFSAPLLFFLSWAYVRYFALHRYRRGSALLYSVLFWLILLAAHFVIARTEDYVSLRHYMQFKFGFLWLGALTLGLSQTTTPEDARILLNPGNALRSSIWPNGSMLSPADPMSRRQLWWQGMLNLANGLLVFSVRMWLQELVWDRFPFQYAHDLEKYFLAMMGIVGFLNVITGAARMFGFQVRDATNFVWLSRTPAEYWRRGAVYHYTFILKYVYLPLYRVVKFGGIASSLAFVIFMMNKNGFVTSCFLILDVCGLKVNNYLYRPIAVHSTLCLWFLWYVVLVITRRVWFVPRSKQNNTSLGWISIFLTHILMSHLYYFSDLLQHYLWQTKL